MFRLMQTTTGKSYNQHFQNSCMSLPSCFGQVSAEIRTHAPSGHLQHTSDHFVGDRGTLARTTADLHLARQLKSPCFICCVYVCIYFGCCPTQRTAAAGEHSLHSSHLGWKNPLCVTCVSSTLGTSRASSGHLCSLQNHLWNIDNGVFF